MVSAKERLHDLVERLSEERAAEALGYLDRLTEGEGEGEASAALERRMGPRSMSASEFMAQRPRLLQELAAEQGVRPVERFEELLGDFWPEDESVDDFVAAVRE